jgi:hypothetical protein
MKYLKDFKDIYWLIGILLPVSVNNIFGLDYPIITLIISVILFCIIHFLRKKFLKKDKEFICIIESLDVINDNMECQFKFNSNFEKLSKRIGNNKLLIELLDYHNEIKNDHEFNFQKYSTPENFQKITKIKEDIEKYKKIIEDYKNKIRD